ncbi:MAG: hypothetical protein ACK4FY_07195, partial [Aquificaceae bacterium]
CQGLHLYTQAKSLRKAIYHIMIILYALGEKSHLKFGTRLALVFLFVIQRSSIGILACGFMKYYTDRNVCATVGLFPGVFMES